MTTSADEPLKPYVENLDPSDDPVVEGHGPGDRAPFPPVWAGDPYAGHSRSCGVRVKEPCTCGMWELEQPGPPETPDTPTGDRADMPVAADYMRTVLRLPHDVHIVGVHWEPLDANTGNIILHLEGFQTKEFPSQRVTALFVSQWNVLTGRLEPYFVGWDAIG